MKSMAGIFLVSLALLFCRFLDAQPTIIPLQVEQTEGLRTVRIVYNLTHSDGLDSSVTVSASRDGGNTYQRVSSLTGDHGPGIPPGDGKEIIWHADADWSAAHYPGVIIRVNAVDGQGGGAYSELVEVPGGSVKIGFNTLTVDTFHIGKYEVTWGEWQDVRSWAASNGYDIGEAGQGCVEDHPVVRVTWYEALKWCNAKSEMEGRTPVYTADGSIYRTGEANPDANQSTDGFRLPLEAEWQFAAGGGNQTHGYEYSGGDGLDAVGWFRDNSEGAACDLSSHRGTWPVGQKAGNELGLYDMSGNASEWCWDAPSYSDAYRQIRGGCWDDFDFNCGVAFNHEKRPTALSSGYGLRLASYAGNGGSAGSHSADFPAIELDLCSGEPIWQESSWYGWFYDMEYPWIWHVEHGCQYCIGDSSGDTESIFFFDNGLQSWIWTCTSLYPFLYKYGNNEGWYWYFTGGAPGSRWFARLADFTYVQESQINDFSGPVTPQGFAYIEAGSFQMGDNFGEGLEKELPVHTVTLSGYFIQETELSNAEFVDTMNWALDQGLIVATTSTLVNLEGNQQELLDLDDPICTLSWNGSRLVVNAGREDHPCTEVSWYGAMAYCHYRTRQEGGLSQAVDISDWSFDITASGYRLPTEAEWERAARGGLMDTRFPWGNTIDHSFANYKANGSLFAYDTSVYTTDVWHPDWDGNGYPFTSTVRSFTENGYGLFNMSGNVWEWCADWYEGYPSGMVINPVGASEGSHRIARGGGWISDASCQRVSKRTGSAPGENYPDVGFRPALTVSP